MISQRQKNITTAILRVLIFIYMLLGDSLLSIYGKDIPWFLHSLVFVGVFPLVLKASGLRLGRKIIVSLVVIKKQGREGEQGHQSIAA